MTISIRSITGTTQCAAVLAAFTLGHTARAADSVTVSVPAFLGFNVVDVTRSTPGAPSPFSVMFSDAVLGPGDSIRMSVQANTSDFIPPAGPAIPVTNVTWTTSNAVRSTGSSGTLLSDSYSQVLISNPNAASGSVDLAWTLAAPGGGIRAGNHTLTASWKVESVSP